MNWHKYVYIIVILCISVTSFAQVQDVDSLSHKNNTVFVAGIGAGLYAGGIAGLYQLWYKGYPQSKLHTTNDNKAWLQIDKIGHAYSNYQLARGAYYAFRSTGTEEMPSVLYGTTYAIAFFSTVELLDGHSERWGFSWGDVIANLGGDVLFAAQQLLWHEQRIQLKFSYMPTKYATLYPKLLGNSILERGLKDYNGQTYWLSFNLASFCSQNNKLIPRYLNITLGYGARGMIGSFDNPNFVDGQSIPHFQRVRQYYLSLDVDFTKIKTSSKFVKHLLFIANCIKLPFPALEYNKEDGLQVVPLMF